MNRRNFLNTFLGMMGIALIAPAVLAEQKRGARPTAAGAGGGDLALPLLDPNSSTAKAVNYVNKHSDLKTAALKTERTGVAWDKQTCAGCGFYTGVGKKGADEVGKCTIFSGQLVKANAWCASWNKKA
ncbi:MAG: high-potential iron-sulfur protein [Bdellovibrionota bacterium]